MFHSRLQKMNDSKIMLWKRPHQPRALHALSSADANEMNQDLNLTVNAAFSHYFCFSNTHSSDQQENHVWFSQKKS